ncbi:carbohydrate ABC transporter permease [Streptomyces albidus (ex Kaewkla and Franco 2022)]|uniref:carbohydrate ABC transporter permease n=1 Tax=Streptomyces albidus (ex Kaewkla and Franco 2022) TaxID=722709 RepID=UPI0015EE5FAE|nr:sugar ABC transporter permease [Streptomyces albidus (ex Kaewkla and Franco 2022)]
MATTTIPGAPASHDLPGDAKEPRTRTQRAPRTTVMAVPALIWYAVFMIGPIGAIFVISVLSWPGMLARVGFAGLGNYRAVLSDPLFWSAVENSAIQLAVAVPVMIVGAFMLGYHISTRPRGHQVLRVIVFTPALISASAKAMIFYGLFAPRGMINHLLSAVGLDGLTHTWLADTSTAFACIIVIDIWAGIGYTATLYAARLSAVPESVYEAAELDGAGHWRRMWGIAFPMVKDYVGVTVMLQFLWTLFTSAQNVLLLTQGGPGNASTNLSFLVYQKAFLQSDLGYSQAAGVLLFVFGLIGMLAIRRVFRQSY